MIIILKTLCHSRHNLDLHTASRMWLIGSFFSRRLKVVLKGGWKPGVHFTIEKTFTDLDVTQTDRVHVHAEPGMQLYPFGGKF